MGVLISALIAVGSVALSFGIQHVVDRVQRTKAEIKGLSQDQVVARLKSMISEVTKKSSAAANAINAKLADIPDASRILNSRASEEIRDSRNRLVGELSQIDQKMTEGQNLSERVSSYAYLPESYKLSDSGRRDMDRITADVETFVRKS